MLCATYGRPRQQLWRLEDVWGEGARTQARASAGQWVSRERGGLKQRRTVGGNCSPCGLAFPKRFDPVEVLCEHLPLRFHAAELFPSREGCVACVAVKSLPGVWETVQRVP